MKVIFLGTPELAVPSLKAIHGKQDVRLVVTQPDRPRGRGLHVEPSPVKAAAEDLDLPVWQPESLRGEEAFERLAATGADILVIVAYGLKIPDAVLEAVPHGAVNMHFSLLPAYRGAAPVNWAVIRGEEVTGVTTFRLTGVMDGGPVYLRRVVPIEKGEMAGDLGKRLADAGAGVLAETLEGIEGADLAPEAQDESRATRAPKLTKEHGRIDWARGAADVVNLVHGVNPWPGAFTELDGKKLKVWRAEVSDMQGEGAAPPGTVLAASPRTGLKVAALDSAVYLTEVQPEGKRHMTAREFLAGHSLAAGRRFS
jgi:methionyl-tRNA formyltransferase